MHFYLAVGFVLFFVVHILQVVKAGWKNFRSMIVGYDLVVIEPTSTKVTQEVTTDGTEPADAAVHALI